MLFLLALFVSCRAGGVVQISGFSNNDQSIPPIVKVINWNTQKGSDPGFLSDLLILFERYEPDLVFLQEARVDLKEDLPMGGYFANGWKYPWRGGTTIGVLTLSKVEPVWIKPVPTRWREFFITAPKVSLITKYPLPNGQRLLAVNVHLLTFERWGTVKLRSQLDELKLIMTAHSGPIIMAGDFNTWNEKRLQLVRELAGSLELNEVTSFTPGRKTADFGSSCLNWVFGVDKDLPLDRIYYRGFKDYSAEVLPYDSSDHRATLVKFILLTGDNANMGRD